MFFSLLELLHQTDFINLFLELCSENISKWILRWLPFLSCGWEQRIPSLVLLHILLVQRLLLFQDNHFLFGLNVFLQMDFFQGVNVINKQIFLCIIEAIKGFPVQNETVDFLCEQVSLVKVLLYLGELKAFEKGVIFVDNSEVFIQFRKCEVKSIACQHWMIIQILA
jgi:hypothetical protein